MWPDWVGSNWAGLGWATYDCLRSVLVFSFVLCYCNQITQGANLKDDFWALDFKDIYPCLLLPMCSTRALWQSEHVAEEFLHIMVEEKQTGQKPGPRYPQRLSTQVVLCVLPSNMSRTSQNSDTHWGSSASHMTVVRRYFISLTHY